MNMPSFESRARLADERRVAQIKFNPRNAAHTKRASQRQLDSSRLRLALLIAVSLILLADLLDQLAPSGPEEVAKPLARGALRLIIGVAAGDSYSEASAESPSVEAALEDEDEDDEELDASASQEYPDGDNDNDEAYEDAEGK